MTQAIQEDFQRSIKECLEIAAEIGEHPDYSRFIAQQMSTLQAFLQQKQNEVEETIKIEIAANETEAEHLKERIHLISSGNITEANIDDRDPINIWLDLKQKSWTELYNYFIAESFLPVPVIVEELLKYLKVTVELTRTRVREAREAIMFQVMFPGEDPGLNKDVRLPQKTNKKEQNLYKELNEYSTNCHLDSRPFCLPSIQKEILTEVLSLKHFQDMTNFTDKMQRTRDKFVNKCIEFAWVAIFDLDDSQLVIDPVRECPNIKDVFIEWDKVVHKQLLVEWPALVCDNKVLIKWVTSSTKQTRQPRELQKARAVDEDPRIQDPQIVDDRRIVAERKEPETPTEYPLNEVKSEEQSVQSEDDGTSQMAGDITNNVAKPETAGISNEVTRMSIASTQGNGYERKGIVPNKNWPTEVEYKLKKSQDSEQVRARKYSPTRGKYYEGLPGGLQF